MEQPEHRALEVGLLGWRRPICHMRQISSIMSSEEMPDNFDQAYDWFSQTFHDPRIPPEHGLHPDDIAVPILNEKEQLAVSNFIEHVLNKPSGAAQIDEGNCLDSEMLVQPKKEYESSLANSEFYRGFVGPLPKRLKTEPVFGDRLPAKPATYPAPSMMGLAGPQSGFHAPPPSSVPPQYPFLYGHPDAPGGAAAPSAGKPRAPPDFKPEASLSPPASSIAHRARSSPPSSVSPDRGPRKKRRDYLTEDQIRQNHIHSEKRRRDLISTHFNEMREMVPGIGSTGKDSLPKSVILSNVYEYILSVASENKRLRQELAKHQVDTSSVQAFKLEPPLADDS